MCLPKIKIYNSSEFKAELICVRYLYKWNIILKNISGYRNNDITNGKKKIFLKDLLPDDVKEKHDKFINNILDNYNNSPYWESFLNGKMQRSVNIINPINKKKFNVKIKLTFVNKFWRRYKFNIEITDIKEIFSNVMNIHNIRLIFKSIITVIDNDTNQNMKTIKSLSKEGIKLCSDKHEIIQKDNLDKIKLHISIIPTINNLNNIYPNIIKYSCECNLCVKDIEFIKHMLFSIVKYSIDYCSKNIIINIKQNNDIIIITINDDCVIDNKINEVLENGLIKDERIEILFLSISEWKRESGSFKYEYLNGNKFEFHTKGIISDNFLLSVDNIRSLYNLKFRETILIVDDSYVNLKMILNNFCKENDKPLTYYKLPSKYEMFIIDDLIEYNLIFTTDGIYAKDIYDIINVKKIIVDIEMPKMNGYDLISYIISINPEQSIIVNSATEKEMFYQKLHITNDQYDIKFIEKGSSYKIMEYI